MKENRANLIKQKYTFTTGLLFVFLIIAALPVGATIVNTDLGNGVTLGGTSANYGFDIDNDDENVFGFMYIVWGSTTLTNSGSNAKAVYGYTAIYSGNSYDMVNTFSYGEEIGESEQWGEASDYKYLGFVSNDGTQSEGEWKEMADYTGYYGFYAFSDLDEKWHYGWIEMKIDYDNNLETTIYGYAWETDPNTAIIAGDTGAAVPVPAGIWLLGGGLAGLLGLRRRFAGYRNR